MNRRRVYSVPWPEQGASGEPALDVGTGEVEVLLSNLLYVIAAEQALYWEGTTPRVRTLLSAFPTTLFPASPSPLCCTGNHLLDSFWPCDQKRVIEFAQLNG